MEKISITIDLKKVDKTRITERTFTNAEGVEETEKNYSLDLIPLKQPKVIKEGPTWKMVKKYFLVQGQTKEERSAKAPSVFMGSGIVFEDITAEAEINPSDVPF